MHSSPSCLNNADTIALTTYLNDSAATCLTTATMIKMNSGEAALVNMLIALSY